MQYPNPFGKLFDVFKKICVPSRGETFKKMTRELTHIANGKTYKSFPATIDRKKFYGRTENSVPDDKGNAYKPDGTDESGTLTVPRGRVAFGFVSGEVFRVLRPELKIIKC
jgi:hypothetical protein